MKKKKIKILLIIFLIINIVFYLNDYLYNIQEKRLVQRYFQTNIKTIKETDNNYLGLLKINAIDLEKGFYSLNDKNNNVNKNIKLLKNSIMPDEDNSIIALASHSGNGKNAYFKNLYKLKINDEVNLYYKDKIYYYNIINIYETEKNGKITIDKNYKNILVLTTCSNKKNKQLVIICQMKSFN